jgi:tetratricopeptide (TPR) repeat protein
MEPPDVDALFDRATQLIQTFTQEDFACMFDDVVPTDRFNRFLKVMRQVLQIDPNHSNALNNIAVMARHVALPEALRAAERLVEIDPSYDNYVVLGKTLLHAGADARAEVVLSNALELGSGFSAWINLAAVRANMGRLQEALDGVENALITAEGENEIATAFQLRDSLLKDLNEIHGGKT